MRNSYIVIIGTLIGVFISCKGPQQEKKQLSKGTAEVTTKINHIQGVLDVSMDTVIINNLFELHVTKDGGKTWKSIKHKISASQLTIDDQKVLWGLDSWVGVHEPSHSRLYRSVDFGDTWTSVEFDPEKFFPYKIFSKPHQRFELQTVDNKVYKLTGNDLKYDWKYIKTVEPAHDNDDIQLPPYHIDYRIPEHCKLYKTIKGKTDTLADLGYLPGPVNVVKVGKILYISGSSRDDISDSYKAYFATVTNERTVKTFNFPESYALVKIGTKGRVWVYDYRTVYLKKGDTLVKFY